MNEIESYTKDNREALMVLQTATDDYLGVRCSLLNGLINSGYVLSEQAIEKDPQELPFSGGSQTTDKELRP